MSQQASPVFTGTFADFLKTETADEPTDVKNKETEAPAKEEKASDNKQLSEAEQAETAGETESPQIQEIERPKRQSRFDKRIGQLTRRIYEQEAELKALHEAQAKEKAPVKATNEQKPLLKDFTTHEEWVEAVSEWTARKVARETSETNIRNQEAAQNAAVQQEIKDAHANRVRQFVAKNDIDDWEETVVDSNAVLHDSVISAIYASPHSAELTYFLGKNPDIAEQFHPDGDMTPYEALREFVRLEDRLFPEKPKTKTTKAPGPPAKIGSAGSSSPKELSQINDYNNWEKEKIAQAKK